MPHPMGKAEKQTCPARRRAGRREQHARVAAEHAPHAAVVADRHRAVAARGGSDVVTAAARARVRARRERERAHAEAPVDREHDAPLAGHCERAAAVHAHRRIGRERAPAM